MTQPTNKALKEFKFFKRFTLIQMMLMIAAAGLLLTFIAQFFQL